MDLVIFLRDPFNPKTHEPDVNNVIRLCDSYNIPLASNLATAELLIKALDRGDLASSQPFSQPRAGCGLPAQSPETPNLQ